MNLKLHSLRLKSGCRVPHNQRGFTFLELMIVMAILAILAVVAIPTYLSNIKRARETRLQHDLWVMNQAIDSYTVDKEKAPEGLQDLVSAGYLRAIPGDAVNNNSTDSWLYECKGDLSQGTASVCQVKSGAEGNDSNGKPYSEY